MLKIIHSIIDQIFPPRENEALIRTLSEKDVLHLFQSHIYKQFTALTSYENKTVQALITENKFHHNLTATNCLAKLLQQYTHDPSAVFLPIPLGKKRFRERGYNQVTEVLKQAGVLFDQTIIIRSKETPPQTSLDRKSRLTNLTDAFSINRHSLSRYQNTTFIIIDDVTTTGATLEAARASLAPLLPTSCTLLCVALAH